MRWGKSFATTNILDSGTGGSPWRDGFAVDFFELLLLIYTALGFYLGFNVLLQHGDVGANIRSIYSDDVFAILPSSPDIYMTKRNMFHRSVNPTHMSSHLTCICDHLSSPAIFECRSKNHTGA